MYTSMCTSPAIAPDMPFQETVDRIRRLSTGSFTSGGRRQSATLLQEAVDRVFNADSQSLLGLDFSLTIADPSLPACPLIGCSTGFTKLTGYELDDIVGQNCRFLVDAVPADLIDQTTRKHTKEFCQAVRDGKMWTPPSDYPYAPTNRPLDELMSMQTNRRKDGTLFNNLLYMKVFDLSSELGDEQPYIVALQSELKEGKEDLSALANNIEKLHARMDQVTQKLASMFFMQCSISRQAFEPRRQISAL